jgi:hypothetical protein
MKGMPDDVFSNYICKDENYVLVKDPKHNDDYFHYTIWCLNENMNDINDLTNEEINKMDKFIKKIKEKNYFNNEKMYFTYPPTHIRLHLHIVSKHYISYRSVNELFFYDEIYKILNQNFCI